MICEAVDGPTLHALFFQEQGVWVSQCIEKDLASQARTLPAARSEIRRVIAVQKAVSAELGQPAFFGIGPAPARYWKLAGMA